VMLRTMKRMTVEYRFSVSLRNVGAVICCVEHEKKQKSIYETLFVQRSKVKGENTENSVRNI